MTSVKQTTCQTLPDADAHAVSAARDPRLDGVKAFDHRDIRHDRPRDDMPGSSTTRASPFSQQGGMLGRTGCPRRGTLPRF
jgi:hypothetical protein